MQTPREVIRNTITFNSPDRLGRNFPDPHGNDFYWTWLSPSPDARPNGGSGVDEWGAVWENIGVSQLGEVKESPLKSWDDFPDLKIPDFRNPARFEYIRGARERAGDTFMLGTGVSLYERPHYLRGLENLWTDIHTDPERLGELIDIMVDMNLHILGEYAANDIDGLIMSDDWGLQDRLMISPEKWREIWKPRYAKVFARAHESGMLTLLHSCGHITEILEDLIEIGCDVIQMDQQNNMGLELLGKRFGGRITFYCPADIQAVIPTRDRGLIRSYCRRMMESFATPRGGFIPKFYSDPKGVGHDMDDVHFMCEEFLRLSREMYGA